MLQTSRTASGSAARSESVGRSERSQPGADPASGKAPESRGRTVERVNLHPQRPVHVQDRGSDTRNLAADEDARQLVDLHDGFRAKGHIGGGIIGHLHDQGDDIPAVDLQEGFGPARGRILDELSGLNVAFGDEAIEGRREMGKVLFCLNPVAVLAQDFLDQGLPGIDFGSGHLHGGLLLADVGLSLQNVGFGNIDGEDRGVGIASLFIDEILIDALLFRCDNRSDSRRNLRNARVSMVTLFSALRMATIPHGDLFHGLGTSQLHFGHAASSRAGG